MCFGAEPERQGTALARRGGEAARKKVARRRVRRAFGTAQRRRLRRGNARLRSCTAEKLRREASVKVLAFPDATRGRSAAPHRQKKACRTFSDATRGRSLFAGRFRSFLGNGKDCPPPPRLQAGPAFVPAFCLNEKPRPGRGGKHAGRTQAISYPRGQEPARYPVLNEIRLLPSAHCGAHTWARYTGGRLSAAIHVRHAQPLLYSL